MKKILSLTLAALMVVSMVPTAFAAEAGGNWAGGTAVDVTGEKTIVAADGSETHNAEYTLTVPAKLAPGAEGTVILAGYWPSDATVKVTADAKVNMVHSINSIDTRDLVVTFGGIEKAGANFGSQSFDAQVSVAAMPEGAMFGTWHGVFNYQVEYDGEAAGTVTPDPEQPSNPDDGDDEANLISFAIKDTDGQYTSYQAKEGMTWDEWIVSEYNTANYCTLNGKVYTNDARTHYLYSGNGSNNSQVKPSDSISACAEGDTFRYWITAA